MRESRREVVVLGVPSAAGASAPGIDDAPRALRAAGLIAACEASGVHPQDRADLPRFPFAEDPGTSVARNLAEVARAVSAVAAGLSEVPTEQLALVLGGGCSLLPGVVRGLARRDGQAPGIVLLDAHADFNTPATSPSGLLDGMALALALGHGPRNMVPSGAVWARAEESALVGFRELDPPERERIETLALALSAQSVLALGMAETAAQALAATGSGRLALQFDIDVLDPIEMPAKDGSPPGPGLRGAELVALLSHLLGSSRTAALVVTGFNPRRDPDGRWARALVALVAQGLGAGLAVS
jgi:arginase